MHHHPRTSNSSATQEAKPRPSLLKPAVLRPVILASGLLLSIGYLTLEMFGGGPIAMASEDQGTTPAVVELFTSQGCYSCPPAEALLGDLIEANDLENIVALEFHVDYWDSLSYGRHGVHKDPFSSADNTLRQRHYNSANLSGQQGVYTPQMVVNGRRAAVGSKRRTILDSIRRADRPTIAVDVVEQSLSTNLGSEEAGLRIELSGDFSTIPDDTHVWLAIFDIKETTKITTGENHDKTLTSHHMVRKLDLLSPQEGYKKLEASNGALHLETGVILGEGQGCAVLLQGSGLGPIHGASYCPISLWKPKNV